MTQITQSTYKEAKLAAFFDELKSQQTLEKLAFSFASLGKLKPELGNLLSKAKGLFSKPVVSNPSLLSKIRGVKSAVGSNLSSFYNIAKTQGLGAAASAHPYIAGLGTFGAGLGAASGINRLTNRR